MTVYKANFDLKENAPIQYLGIYATQWQQEWGEPSVSFLKAEYQLDDALDDLMSVQLVSNTSAEGKEAYKEIVNILLKLVT